MSPRVGRCASSRISASSGLPRQIRVHSKSLLASLPREPRTFRELLVQHGDHLLPYGSWLITETANFDELAASDPTMGDELSAAAARLGVDAPRVTYYAPRITALVENARTHSGVAPGAGTICYVPAYLFGDSRHVGGCNFDDAWAHRWHLRILELMTTRPDLRFIWKGLPSTDQAVDPIPAIIAEREIPTSRTKRGHSQQWSARSIESSPTSQAPRCMRASISANPSSL